MISAEAEEVVEVPGIQKRPGTLLGFWNQYKKSRLGLIGMFVMIFFVLVAVFAPFIATHNPDPGNVVGPGYNSPESLRIFDTNAIKDGNIGLDQDCQELSKWQAYGFNDDFSGGSYDLTNLPTNYTDANGNLHYNLTSYNDDRGGLDITEIIDDHSTKTDGEAFKITLDTTQGDYDRFSMVGDYGAPNVVLRQDFDWTEFVVDDPTTIDQIPRSVRLMLRYRIKYSGDLLNETLYPTDTDPRKHFDINIRIIPDYREFDGIGKTNYQMTFPLAPEYPTYNPREYYTLNDKLVGEILIYNNFQRSYVDSDTGDTVYELNKGIILQLEALFHNTDEFQGSIEIIVDQFYLEIEDSYFGILGTSGTGADVFSQLIFGTQVSLLVGALATFFSVSLGIVVGLVAGFVGGRVDDLLMRFVDFLLIMPGLPLMLVLASVLRPSFWNIIIVISVLYWTGTARIIRAQTLAEKEKAYVSAAKAAGGSDLYIIFRHILPNVLPIVFAQMATGVSGSIQSEAAISFLGLGGVEVSWGKMLQESTQGAFTRGAWWMVLFPGLAICILSLSFILVGHTIEQIVNPRLREM
ncbi:MAG: ABC transporter permease [Candidatus Hodarchaeales archaeon]|jgi:peptide/nickel transport system permease protein